MAQPVQETHQDRPSIASRPKLTGALLAVALFGLGLVLGRVLFGDRTHEAPLDAPVPDRDAELPDFAVPPVAVGRADKGEADTSGPVASAATRVDDAPSTETSTTFRRMYDLHLKWKEERGFISQPGGFIGIDAAGLVWNRQLNPRNLQPTPDEMVALRELHKTWHRRLQKVSDQDTLLREKALAELEATRDYEELSKSELQERHPTISNYDSRATYGGYWKGGTFLLFTTRRERFPMVFENHELRMRLYDEARSAFVAFFANLPR